MAQPNTPLLRHPRRPLTLGRIAARLAAGAVVAVGLAACGSDDSSMTARSTLPAASSSTVANPAASPVAFPVTIEHAFGSTTIEAQPERIVALSDGSQDVVAALGLMPVGIPSGYPGSNADGVLPWYAEHFHAEATTLLPVFDGLPFEAIAELQPDVILAPYAGFPAPDYELLTAIAPTVAYPGDAWSTPWQTQTRMIGRAVGREADAEALITDVEQTLSGLAGAHPELQGKSFTYLFSDGTQVWAYMPSDARVELVTALGLQPSPGVLELAAADPDSIVAELSYERLADVDADIVIIEQSDGPADASRIPLLDQLGASRAGAVITYGTDDAALSTALIPTVLSIPWAAERLVADLAAVATSTGD